MQIRQRRDPQKPAMFQIWRSLQWPVVPGIVVNGEGRRIVRVVENLQILASHILGMAQKKSLGVRFENGLPDFVVFLRNGRSKQAAES